MHRTRAAVAYDQARHMEILGRIQAPVTVAFGDRSWYLQLPDLDGRLAHIPDVRQRVTMDAGHALHIDQGATVAALVTDGPLAPDATLP
jgi:pimeloyl-ACP methyl ester carboxylesterase